VDLWAGGCCWLFCCFFLGPSLCCVCVVLEFWGHALTVRWAWGNSLSYPLSLALCLCVWQACEWVSNMDLCRIQCGSPPTQKERERARASILPNTYIISTLPQIFFPNKREFSAFDSFNCLSLFAFSSFFSSY